MVAKSLLVRLDGRFDLAAAGEVRRALLESPDGTEVYVDMSQVREFHDGAVAVLADALKAARRAVSVRGLRQHQYRMLRYLGVDASSLDPGLAPRRRAVSSVADSDG
ncbi:MAG TPA: STAS domain-containing protein [Anaeromyxobacteraceae bacterium]|nr:STAS domain-containing protein [Anaeromyxobacteraceae bacterium]